MENEIQENAFQWQSEPIPVEGETGQPSLRFVPTSRTEMAAAGWDALDILLVSGDAYVDHPSFGIPLLARLLIRQGYRVGILAQPLFPGFHVQRSPVTEQEALADFRRMGTPRLFVGIGAGVVDSMLNHYTANKRTRSDDMYSECGAAGFRPDYATIVYSSLARKAFPSLPIICGGVEASLRRLAHFDYWQGRVRPSILADLSADLVVFGMGERQILRIARELKARPGRSFDEVLESLRCERGLAYLAPKDRAKQVPGHLNLPSFEEVRDDKKKFARAAVLIEGETNPASARPLVQYHGSKAVILTPPALPLQTAELDSVYASPFSKEPHPVYQGKIPAAEMIRFSVTVNRGCVGGCSFCAIALHQGRVVQSRSRRSVLEEIKNLRKLPTFKGIVTDVGGPTANTYMLGCKSPDAQKVCRRHSCLFPSVCPNFSTDHSEQIRLLREARALPGIRKILISSGVRFDLALKDPRYVEEMISHHVGGHMKVAPEHTDPKILSLMRKPSFAVFEAFRREFDRISRKVRKEQFLVPYFISSFPGTTEAKMESVHAWLRKEGWKLQQVQAFIPTPMTLATAMYWSGIDPVSKEPIEVARDARTRKLHQALLQPHRPENQKLLRQYREKKRRERR